MCENFPYHEEVSITRVKTKCSCRYPGFQSLQKLLRRTCLVSTFASKILPCFSILTGKTLFKQMVVLLNDLLFHTRSCSARNFLEHNGNVKVQIGRAHV